MNEMTVLTDVRAVPDFIDRCREICGHGFLHREVGPQWNLAPFDWITLNKHVVATLHGKTGFVAYNDAAVLFGYWTLEPTTAQLVAYEVIGRSTGEGLPELREAFWKWAEEHDCNHVIVCDVKHASNSSDRSRDQIMRNGGYVRWANMYVKMCNPNEKYQ